MEQHPLTTETWPVWRDYYVRLYYAYEVGEPKDFYERIRAFIGAIASPDGRTLPQDWAADPVAWVILSGHLQKSSPELLLESIEASRRALALGDPSGMSSLSLAQSLIGMVAHVRTPGELTADSEQKLTEAEDLLQAVEQAAPQARLSFLRGLIAWFRGEQAAAIPLLRQGTFDYPAESTYAATYLGIWLASEVATKPFAETTDAFVRRFPDDARIQAIHATALYRDERFSDAYEALRQARRQDDNVAAFLGPETTDAIEEGRWLTPSVLKGVKLAQNKLHTEATPEFRNALDQDPENVLAARFLARSLLAQADAGRINGNTAELRAIVKECALLCQRFPDDAELQVAHAGSHSATARIAGGKNSSG
jgi:tetratricopeptide (TPR) repeat protein